MRVDNYRDAETMVVPWDTSEKLTAFRQNVAGESAIRAIREASVSEPSSRRVVDISRSSWMEIAIPEPTIRRGSLNTCSVA